MRKNQRVAFLVRTQAAERPYPRKPEFLDYNVGLVIQPRFAHNAVVFKGESQRDLHRVIGTGVAELRVTRHQCRAVSRDPGRLLLRRNAPFAALAHPDHHVKQAPLRREGWRFAGKTQFELPPVG